MSKKEVVYGGVDAEGREILDPLPLAPLVRGRRELTSTQQMRKLIQAVSREAAQAGAESLEEANDFELDDGEEWSPYEFDEDEVLERKLAEQFALRRAARERANTAKGNRATVARKDILGKVATEDLTAESRRRSRGSRRPQEPRQEVDDSD